MLTGTSPGVYYCSDAVFAFLTTFKNWQSDVRTAYRPFAPDSVVIPEVDHKRFLLQILAGSGFSDCSLDLNSWRKLKSEKANTWNVEDSISADLVSLCDSLLRVRSLEIKCVTFPLK